MLWDFVGVSVIFIFYQGSRQSLLTKGNCCLLKAPIKIIISKERIFKPCSLDWFLVHVFKKLCRNLVNFLQVSLQKPEVLWSISKLKSQLLLDWTELAYCILGILSWNKEDVPNKALFSFTHSECVNVREMKNGWVKFLLTNWHWNTKIPFIALDPFVRISKLFSACPHIL